MIYRLRFCNKEGIEARVDIQKGLATPVIEVEGTDRPFILSYNNDKGNKSGMFLTSSADIEIYETADFNIDNLKTSNETELSVTYYINNVISWKGFIIPDFFSIEVRSNPIIVMTASDRLGTLKNGTLSDLPSMISLRELAILCLNKTGLTLPLKTMADFSNGTGVNDFFNSKILTQRLSDTKGRNISCYDVLSSILTASNSFLTQRSGEWYIVNKYQHEIGSGKLYDTATTSTNWSEVIHDFSEITVGGRRTIVPVGSSVGVYQEFGGGKLYPENYDFSEDLLGWTPVGGFSASINNKEIKGYYQTYNLEYGEVTDKKYLVNSNNYSNTSYIQTADIPVPYTQGEVEVSVDMNVVGPRVAFGGNKAPIRIAIVAKKGSSTYYLNNAGSFTSTSPYIHEFLFGDDEQYPLDQYYKPLTMNVKVSGKILSPVGYTFQLRIYGSNVGPDGNITRVTTVNFARLNFGISTDIPKGTIYKSEQGSNFTKTHDLETSIFGDYLTNGLNGYFYDYPKDDTSSLFNNAGVLTNNWATPTDTEQLPLLQHISRQKARMFSVAHDLLTAEIEVVNFDPLAIFRDCDGKRYSIVTAEVDFFNARVNLDIEQIIYDGTISRRDFIYSYFGDGEKGVQSIGGMSAGSGGGSTGSGLTSEQIEILSFWKKDPDNPNTIFTEMNAYSKLELSAYGVGDGDGGGGGGSDYERLDTWASYDSSKSGWVLSALLGNDLNTRVTAIDGRVTDLENSAGGGSVTSVGISVPTGLSVSNSPITSSGVIAIGLQTGYSIPTTVKQGQWDTAFTNNHTHANKTVLDGITSTLLSNWNTAFTNNHTHANKTQLDLITQSNIDVLARLSIVNGNLQINGNAYATGELSAYGAGTGGGGGGGIIDTVYGYGNLGHTFNNSVLTDTFNAYTINQINTRLVSVESGSATTVNTTGTGNAITSISKVGSVITANKDLTFLETSIFNTHNNDNVRHITGAERAKWNGVVTDLDNLEIGGRNLLLNTKELNGFTYATADKYLDFNICRTTRGTSGYLDTFRATTIAPPEGDTHVVSFYAKSSVPTPMSCYWFSPNTTTSAVNSDGYTSTSIDGVSILNITTEWKRYWIVWTQTPTNTIKTVIIGRNATVDGATIEIAGVKLEKGNKATDWTPAPEDQVSDWLATDVNSFSFIKNKPTLLSQFTDNIGVSTHIANTSNPHSVTKAQVGLGNVDNTSDLNKPISTATQTALNLKANLANTVTTDGAQTITGAKTFRNTGESETSLTLLSLFNNIPYIEGNGAGAVRIEMGHVVNHGYIEAGATTDTSSSTGYLAFGNRQPSNNVTEVMRIVYTGNVGIGTDNPAYKLDVSGTGRFTGNVTAPTFSGDLSGNATSATTLQTSRTIWGQSFNGGTDVSGAMTAVTTIAMTGGLSGATTIQASISVASPKVIFNAAGWSMEQVGSELQMKHNNVLKMRFTSTGSIVATEEITAFG